MTEIHIYRMTAAMLAVILSSATVVRGAWHHGADVAVLAPPQPAASLSSGVYTDAQAARGKALYQAHCVTCHLELHNATPPLAGEAFRAKWAPLSANDLFTKMRDTMPTIEPGMLAPAEYIDLVAYVLHENKAPAGTKELTIDEPMLKNLSLADLAKP